MQLLITVAFNCHCNSNCVFYSSWVKCSLSCIFVQAWSIVFHSWLSFVLLISACLMWILPKKRQLCLRCSPIVVVYAICLVTLQYVYGFNLNDNELPTTANGYNLSEIGLVKYRYPVGPLATQVGLLLPRCSSNFLAHTCQWNCF